jgi:hypothetical protein
MKALVTASTLVALVTASAAQAQDASKAFECNLPYRDTMMAMASLEVVRQGQVKGFIGLHGDGDMIEFAPGNTLIYGIKPKNLSLQILPPHPTVDIGQDYEVVFSAKFARTDANDEAIKKSVKWHFGQCTVLENCYRAAEAEPEGGGKLTYKRLPSAGLLADHDPELECKFKFTEKEFEALGN